MKIDDSNKRYSIIIAGILIGLIASIFLVITSGYWGLNKSFNTTYPIDMGSYVDLDKKAWKDHTSGNIKSVSVAEECSLADRDTEKGKIKPYTPFTNIPSKLPLCINDSVVANWWIAYYVCGSYKPNKIDCSYYGFLDLSQTKATDKGGRVFIRSYDITDVPCCWKIVNFTGFDVIGDFELASNYFPDVVPAGCVMTETAPNADHTLGKPVKLDLTTYWKGCDSDYQKFKLILTQYKLCFQNPQLPNGKNNFHRQLNVIMM